MITLNVENYCQNCPDFEADIEKINESSYATVDEFSFVRKPIMAFYHTIIKCKHAAKCAEIKRYLEKEK